MSSSSTGSRTASDPLREPVLTGPVAPADRGQARPWARWPGVYEAATFSATLSASQPAPSTVPSVMDRNLALRQQGLKCELAHFGETACLREGQPLLLEQRQGKFLLQLRLSDMSGHEHFI